MDAGRIPHVVSAQVCGDHSLRLVFDDGLTKQVNLRRYLQSLGTPSVPAFVGVAGTGVIDQDVAQDPRRQGAEARRAPTPR